MTTEKLNVVHEPARFGESPLDTLNGDQFRDFFVNQREENERIELASRARILAETDKKP